MTAVSPWWRWMLQALMELMEIPRNLRWQSKTDFYGDGFVCEF